MRFEHEATTIGVDQRMALVSVDFLARIVAARPASLGRLSTLAINDCSCRAGLASDPFAVEHDQSVIDPLEAAFIPKLRKPAIDCTPWRQIAWQQPPRTARPHHIEDAVNDLAHRPGARSSGAMRRRQLSFDHAPFRNGHISLVSDGLAVMLLSSGWGPQGNSGVCLAP